MKLPQGLCHHRPIEHYARFQISVLDPSERGFEDVAATVFGRICVSHHISLMSEFQMCTHQFIQIQPGLFSLLYI
jgi:hypothetical protein